MPLKASFISFLQSRFPQLEPQVLETAVSDQLLSPFQISLTADQIEKLREEIRHYWKLREWGTKNLKSAYSALGLKEPSNFSVCMSYDFHINSSGQPELIEINTNAAFLAMGLQMYEFLNLPTITGFTKKNLIEMFRHENSLSLQKNQHEISIAIIDENPQNQRLYVEFLLYQQLFREVGITCEIHDFRETEKIRQASLIYNRYTDFFLEQPQSKDLRDLFNQRGNFSPNPYEYFLLADKQRQLDWNQQTDISAPSSLLPLYDLAKADKENIWSLRKNLFIKPKHSFGSKQAYRAASISRKTFEEVFNENFIAQQLSTPSEIEVIYKDKPLKMKYDLRCFAYKDELQLIVARIYQGQTTNLRTDGGGFAAIRLVPSS